MKVNIEMENLEKLIEVAMNKNVETVIKNEVDNAIKDEITKKSKNIIEQIVAERMTTFVDEYIKTATISVGGGFYSDEPAKTYTMEEYIKKELADTMKTGKLKVKQTSGYDSGKMKEVSFEEYVKQTFNVEELIKKELESFMTKIKKDINSKVDTTFNDVTKNMLSETVFNVLMKNDTFAKIKNNVKCIADKKD